MTDAPDTVVLTIAEDGTETQAFSTGRYTLAGIQGDPDGWDAASLIPLGSNEATGVFQEIVKDDDGASYEILIAEDKHVQLDAHAFVMTWPWLKFRSVAVGDPSTPVQQQSERTLLVHMKAT